MNDTDINPEDEGIVRELANLPTEPVPTRVTASLTRIPSRARQKRQALWLTAAAAALAAVLILPTMQAPAPADIERAQHDMRIAFGYLRKASQSAQQNIEASVGLALNDHLSANTLQTLSSYLSAKEETNQ